MSKAYSNRALPAGTILREWRLEEVLGVGGFGIVYKGRGIYFNELVAIKEYFPSSISEREEDATVVPIDSDVEEVHALGLKKFVEEAKLLWNLSTPTRHPNIVSVRSLFEIHGTAYMVMDFEDGTSLSTLLKKKQRWNESSLSAMIRPIAEGLERAHRVGVLHRDIKPPNILINEDNKPVLIDFGSARFESGDATSTTVTFHTPPYAAIEQYVRTYQQGPWTDIYALGVVLYECITGTKPPEVLERMHGGLGKELIDGDWPGYSGKFLNAVNAAMEIRPEKRPKSVSEWLTLFDGVEGDVSVAPTKDFDPDATRVGSFAANEAIVPVAPPPAGFTRSENIETSVPDDLKEVKFKLVGEDTAPSANERVGKTGKAAAKVEAAKSEAEAKTPELVANVPGKPRKTRDTSSVVPMRRPSRAAIAGLGALAAGLVIGAAWYAIGSTSSSRDPTSTLAARDFVVADVDAQGDVSADVLALIEEARKANAPEAAITLLVEATSQLDSVPAPAEGQIRTIASKAASDFATALFRDAESRTQQMARNLRWANPRLRNPAAAENAQRQQIARDVRVALTGLRDAADGAASASDDPGAALTAAYKALSQTTELNSAVARAYRSGALTARASDVAAVDAASSPAQTAVATSSERAPSSAPSGRPNQMFPAKFRSFNSIIRSARDLVSDVVGLGNRDVPGANASAEERESYRIRQQNAQNASAYGTYLDGLEATMRGERTEAEVDLNIANAELTRGYLRELRSASRAARR